MHRWGVSTELRTRINPRKPWGAPRGICGWVYRPRGGCLDPPDPGCPNGHQAPHLQSRPPISDGTSNEPGTLNSRPQRCAKEARHLELKRNRYQFPPLKGPNIAKVPWTENMISYAKIYIFLATFGYTTATIDRSFPVRSFAALPSHIHHPNHRPVTTPTPGRHARCQEGEEREENVRRGPLWVRLGVVTRVVLVTATAVSTVVVAVMVVAAVGGGGWLW